MQDHILRVECENIESQLHSRNARFKESIVVPLSLILFAPIKRTRELLPRERRDNEEAPPLAVENSITWTTAVARRRSQAGQAFVTEILLSSVVTKEKKRKKKGGWGGRATSQKEGFSRIDSRREPVPLRLSFWWRWLDYSWNVHSRAYAWRAINKSCSIGGTGCDVVSMFRDRAILYRTPIKDVSEIRRWKNSFSRKFSSIHFYNEIN